MGATAQRMAIRFTFAAFDHLSQSAPVSRAQASTRSCSRWISGQALKEKQLRLTLPDGPYQRMRTVTFIQIRERL